VGFSKPILAGKSKIREYPSIEKRTKEEGLARKGGEMKEWEVQFEGNFTAKGGRSPKRRVEQRVSTVKSPKKLARGRRVGVVAQRQEGGGGDTDKTA